MNANNKKQKKSTRDTEKLLKLPNPQMALETEPESSYPIKL